MFKSVRGFTLIELLVVVTIISILMLAGITVYANFLKNARDTRRQADLKFIQSGLEQYFADQKYYPSGGFTTGGQLTNSTGAPSGISVTKVYISTIPSDPTKNPDYSYAASPNGCNNTTQNCTNYCIFTKLENTTLPNSPGCNPSGSYTYGLSKP